jgi:hypothetical protein
MFGIRVIPTLIGVGPGIYEFMRNTRVGTPFGKLVS